MADGKKFQIKSYYEVHICLRKAKSNEVILTWIVKKFDWEVKIDPKMTIDTLVEKLR